MAFRFSDEIEDAFKVFLWANRDYCEDRTRTKADEVRQAAKSLLAMIDREMPHDNSPRNRYKKRKLEAMKRDVQEALERMKS